MVSRRFLGFGEGCVRGGVGDVCRGLAAYLTDIHRGASFMPRATVILNSKLKSCTRRVGVRAAVSCGSVGNFPASAIPKRGNEFMFKCISDIPIIVVRKEMRCCRKCPVASIILPAHLVKVVNTGGLVLAGTTNNLGASFGPKSFVLVSSRVTATVPDPLVKTGVSRLNRHFPSVDRMCDHEVEGVMGRGTSGLNVGLERKICMRLANPRCRAPTRIEVYGVLKKSTIKVDATYRTLTTHRVKLRIYKVSYVAGLTTKLSSGGLGRGRIRRATSHITGRFARLVATIIETIWVLEGLAVGHVVTCALRSWLVK